MSTDQRAAFEEFAVDIGHDGSRHKLGVFAVVAAPGWEDKDFAVDPLAHVHQQLGPSTRGRCVPRMVIAVEPAVCN